MEDDLAVDLGGFVVEQELRFLEEADGLGVQRGLALVDLLNEFLDAVFVEIAFGLGSAGRSSVKMISRPELRKASSRRRWPMRPATKTVVSLKISESGLKLM